MVWGIGPSRRLLQALVESKKSLAQLAADLTLYPQVLINVKTAQKIDLANHAQIQASVHAAEKELRGRGRILLRASGTEPLIRVMVEGENQLQVQTLAQNIADVVTQASR